MTQFRQGDVFIVKREKPIPKTVTKVPKDGGDVILAYGEVTGHAHRIAGSTAVLLQTKDGSRILQVTKDTVLTHEEHAQIELVEGTYDIIQQREYRPEGSINVAD